MGVAVVQDFEEISFFLSIKKKESCSYLLKNNKDVATGAKNKTERTHITHIMDYIL